MKRGLVLDLDNTLYDFDTYFATSMRAMVHALHRKTTIEEHRLESDIAAVFLSHGSLEYPAIVQELPSIGEMKLSEEDLGKLISLARGAFRRSREKYLVLYPGVREILKWAREQGITVIGFSNAPRFAAEGRLRHLQIQVYFEHLFSIEDDPELPDDILQAARPYVSRVQATDMQPHLRKPNPHYLRYLLEAYSLSPESTFLVGDSLERDIRVANAVGLQSVWARYGTIIDDKTKATLERLFPLDRQIWREERAAQLEVVPTFVIDSFWEVKDIVSIQLRLF